MSNDALPLQTLIAVLRARLAAGSAMDDQLDAVLRITGARATGIWRVVDCKLVLVAFRAVADMPLVVQTGFCDATGRVPLSACGLGIVKAVVTAAPARSEVDPEINDPATSATWLQRFDCERSLAVPIVTNDRVSAVIAISTARSLDPSTGTWLQMIAIASGLDNVFAQC